MIIKLTNTPATGFLRIVLDGVSGFPNDVTGEEPRQENQIQEKSIRAKLLKILSLVVYEWRKSATTI